MTDEPDTQEPSSGSIIGPSPFELALLKREASNSSILNELLVVLKDIRSSINEDKPDLFRQYAFPITDESRSIDSGSVPTMPWLAFTLCNDGPNSVYVFVNDKLNIREQPSVDSQSSNVSAVKKGESIKFNMRRSGIKRVYLQCASAETASVRIFSESISTKEG